MVRDDEGNNNVIKNYNKHASGVNQFFPTMLKTRVQNGSIYDWFTDEYKDKFQKVIKRILKRDSMYNWSKCVKDGEEMPENFFIVQHKHNAVESIYKTLSVEEVEKLDDKYKTNLPKELDGDTYKFLVRDFELEVISSRYSSIQIRTWTTSSKLPTTYSTILIRKIYRPYKPN